MGDVKNVRKKRKRKKESRDEMRGKGERRKIDVNTPQQGRCDLVSWLVIISSFPTPSSC